MNNSVLQKFKSKNRGPIPSLSKGFTFLELIFVITIFGIVASITVFSYQQFSSKVALQNVIQDVALLVGGAQKQALAGQIPVLPGPNQEYPDTFSWASSYGAHFSLSTPDRMIAFFDRNDDAGESPSEFYPGRFLYEDGVTNDCYLADQMSECLDMIQLPSKVTLSLICVNQVSLGTCAEVDSMDVTYTRPEPGATFASADFSDLIADVSLHFSSDNGFTKRVDIFSTGQIRVK